MRRLWMASAAALALTACSGQEASQTAAPIETNALSAAQDDRKVETTSRDDWGAFGLDAYSIDRKSVV